MFSTKMMRQVVAAGGYSPNAVKFDGANDYLAKSTKLTGAADASTGILSFWIRFDSGDTAASPYVFNIKDATDSATVLTVYMNAGKVAFSIRNNGATIIVTFNTSALVNGAANTGGGAIWFHILSSWDMNYSAGNKLKHLYVNDVSDLKDVVDSGAAFSIPYSTVAAHYSAAAATAGGNKLNGAISELYFAPGQYLDFSTESNRRKFIDANGLPVSLGATGATPTGTAPAIYLKGDYTAFGVNSGSGGDFTLIGALEKASSTPVTTAINAVKFDGAADRLTKAATLTGLSDGKSGLLNVWFRFEGSGNGEIFSTSSNASSNGFYVRATTTAVRVIGRDSAGAAVLNLNAAIKPSNYWHNLAAAWDLNTGSAAIYLDGVAGTVTTATSGSTIDYVTSTPHVDVGASWGGGIDWYYYFSGAISELYFTTEYLDLSVEANRRKFITADGEPADLGADGSTPTGTAPLIYLPNRAALVGTNAGTGGNFTINGAPKDANSTPLYYYAEPATFDGSNDYLTRGGDLTGIADGKAGTVSFWMRADTAAAHRWVLSNLLVQQGFYVSHNAANVIRINGRNAAGSDILTMYSNSTYGLSAVWIHVLSAWDLALGIGYLYVNNASDLQAGPTLTNDTIDYATATPDWAVGAATNGSFKVNAAIADLWFDTTYLDISQASVRAKFIDQTTLRPVPLGAKGELPTGSQPLLYLGRDYANFHTNLGSGGAFTVTGALTRGTTSPSDVTA